MKIHLKDAATDQLSLCGTSPGTKWVLREASPQQAAEAVCLMCAKTANKSQPDQEERKLLADLESCRANEVATSDQLSMLRRSVEYSVYKELGEALNVVRLMGNQKLFAYREYRRKKGNLA